MIQFIIGIIIIFFIWELLINITFNFPKYIKEEKQIRVKLSDPYLLKNYFGVLTPIHYLLIDKKEHNIFISKSMPTLLSKYYISDIKLNINYRVLRFSKLEYKINRRFKYYLKK